MQMSQTHQFGTQVKSKLLIQKTTSRTHNRLLTTYMPKTVVMVFMVNSVLADMPFCSSVEHMLLMSKLVSIPRSSVLVIALKIPHFKILQVLMVIPTLKSEPLITFGGPLRIFKSILRLFGLFHKLVQ